MGTMHGFADTVRFRGRGLIVDCAVTTGPNRIIRGGAVMPFTSCSVSASRQTTQMSSISFWCVTLRTRCERCQIHQKDMCAAKSRHMRSRQQYFVVACKRRTVRGLGSRARGAVRSFSVFEHRRLRWYVLAVE